MPIKRRLLNPMPRVLVRGVIIQRPLEHVRVKGDDGPDKLGMGHRDGEIPCAGEEVLGVIDACDCERSFGGPGGNVIWVDG